MENIDTLIDCIAGAIVAGIGALFMNLLPTVPIGPDCGRCHKPMAFMTTIQRVTQAGRVLVFQCAICEKLDFRPES
jgi:hypothetical protein